MSNDQEIRLISVMADAIDRGGVGPKRAVEIMDTVESIVDPIVALVADDPDHGPEQVQRAVDYVSRRAQDRKRQQEENESKRKPKAAPVSELSDLDATADEIAARVQEPPPLSSQ